MRSSWAKEKAGGVQAKRSACSAAPACLYLRPPDALLYWIKFPLRVILVCYVPCCMQRPPDRLVARAEPKAWAGCIEE